MVMGWVADSAMACILLHLGGLGGIVLAGGRFRRVARVVRSGVAVLVGAVGRVLGGVARVVGDGIAGGIRLGLVVGVGGRRRRTDAGAERAVAGGPHAVQA